MKSKLALAIVGVLAFGAATANAAEIYNKNGNKLDFYGKVKAEHDFNTTGQTSSEDATYARIGVKGQTQINDQLTGFGHWEYNLNAADAEGSQGAGKTRLAFAGLSAGDLGSIDAGRNYGILYDVGSYTDNLTEFGGDSFQNTDNFMNGRANNLVTYRNDNFFGLVDGLALGVQYQGKNEKDTRTLGQSNGDGFGYSLQYAIGDTGASVGGAYSHSNAADNQNGAKNAEAWAVAAKYDANSIYLATMYGETRNQTELKAAGGDLAVDALAPKTQNFEVMAAYTFDFGLQPTVGYVQSKALGNGQSVDRVKYAQVGAAYYFNKNFSVDAAYKFNLLKDNSPFASDDQAVVGATYQF
ncbi:porin [Salmonella enterica]|nr:porin [Salmonella enterica]